MQSTSPQQKQSSNKGGAVQTKLTVNAPGDRYEQEADAMADQIMRMPNSPGLETPSMTPLPGVQRKCDACKEEEEMVQRKPLMMKAEGTAQVPTAAFNSQLNHTKGNGSPLPHSTRNFMNEAFGVDFSKVKVHTGEKAMEMNQGINARAFTYGPDIYFNRGEYNPDSLGGRHLLAHELTHVVQQGGGLPSIQRAVNGTASARTIRPNVKVCLVHLHADERNALATASDIYSRYPANMVQVQNPTNNRYLQVSGLTGGGTCNVDPNRIFSTQTVTENCGLRSCSSSLRTQAATDVHSSFRSTLIGLINQCRGSAASGSSLDTSDTLLPIIALHNTDHFNVREYARGGGEEWAAATMAEIRTMATAARVTLPSGIQNPMGPASRRRSLSLDKRYFRNFFVVTDVRDFVRISGQGYNVVLQSPNPRTVSRNTCSGDDGSLSIALRSARYLNLEVAGKVQNASIVAFNTTMASDALTQMGIQPTPATPPTVTPSPPTVAPKISKTPGTQGTIQRLGNPITEADLPSPSARGISTSEQTLRRFMREVYRRQVALWTATGATYLHEVPSSELVTLPGSYAIPGRTVEVHRDIQTPVTNMINDARVAMAAANSAGGPAAGVTNVGIRSGYRSATSQFGIWTTWAPQYYRRTRADRQDTSRFPGGEHSHAAAQFLAEYTNQRVFSPGFSPHQHGRTVDVSYQDARGWAPADTTSAWISRWTGSWFFGWLQQNAFRYGFFQNPNLNEPWHWEFDQNTASILRLLQLLLDLLEPWLGQIDLWLGDERSAEPPSGEETPIREREPTETE